MVSLSEGDKEDLKCKLQDNYESIVFEFASYVHCIKTQLKEKNVSVDELCSFLLFLKLDEALKAELMNPKTQVTHERICSWRVLLLLGS